MTKGFEEQLSKINSQTSVLKGMDEKAVEFGVILPLLGQLGWDTANLSEIYPQWQLPSGGKVDFDLQINSESRVFIEVKNWSVELKSDGSPEEQLENYCREGKPALAVLTNGCQWWLYISPSRWNKKAKLANRLFLEFAVTDEPSEVERSFRQFLARDKMSSAQLVNSTIKAARELLKERQSQTAVMQGLTDAWNELAADEQTMEYVVTKLAELREIPAKESQVKQFLDSKKPSVNKIESKPPPSFPKPASFTFQAEDKPSVVRTVPKNKGWNELLISVCELMREYHCDTFSETLLKMPEWFSISGDYFKYSNPIGDTGLYAKYGGRNDIKERIPTIVAKFRYPSDYLTIEER